MPPPPPYSSELAVALRAVHAASLLTKAVLRALQNSVEAETKADDSPVTVADFAAQALLISAVHAVYPGDGFVGEESASALRRNEQLAERVWELVRRAREGQVDQKSELQHVRRLDAEGEGEGEGERGAAAALTVPLKLPASKDEMLDAIDLGGGEQTQQGRVWVLDPVDGTATFMEGKQYAVCLCLLVDGVQQVGVIGCPNLKLEHEVALGGHGSDGQRRIREDQVDEAGYGVVVSAVKGQGTFVRRMHATALGEARKMQQGHDHSLKDASALDFVESTLGKTSLSQREHRAVAERLGAKWPGTVLWSQQMKYIALALGATDALLRLPTGKDRYTHVWDHAGGQLLFQEAGGIIKDIEGGDIDFGQGRRLLGTRNFGMVAAMPAAFDGIMQAVKAVLDQRTR